jgi:hypothetical protein
MLRMLLLAVASVVPVACLRPTAVHGMLDSRGTCTMVLLGSLSCNWQFLQTLAAEPV